MLLASANSGSPALTVSKCEGTHVALSPGAGCILGVHIPICLLIPDHDPRAEHAASAVAGAGEGKGAVMAKANPRHHSLMSSVNNSTN